MSASKLGYVSRNCPAEKAALTKEHCEGRKSTSDIEPRYAVICSDAAISDEMAQEGQREETRAAPTESVEMKTEEKIQQGIKSLRGLFGF